MKFKIWLETTGSSIRRKLQTAIASYLGRSFAVKSFKVDPNHGENESGLFGKSDGIRQDNGDIIVKDMKSGIHELLHQAGFMPIGIGEFLNEGITQLVTEDIAKQNKLPISHSYRENTEYVRKYVLPATGLDLPTLARQYAKSQNKGKLIVDLIWAKNQGKFNNTEDWGTDPYSSMLRTLPFIIGPYNSHLNFITR
jgi:hypothetical protein